MKAPIREKCLAKRMMMVEEDEEARNEREEEGDDSILSISCEERMRAWEMLRR